MSASRAITAVLCVGLLVAWHTAHAASFDCARAGTQIEKRICSDDVLSHLDSRLGHAYAMAAHDARIDLKHVLVSDQKYWLESVRNGCSDVVCLSRAYEARLRELTLIRTDKVSAEYVTDDQVLASQTADFQRSLNEVGLAGNLSCVVMIRLRIELPSGRDSSYGALCPLQGTRRTFMVCNDTLVGKLTVSFQGGAGRRCCRLHLQPLPARRMRSVHGGAIRA